MPADNKNKGSSQVQSQRQKNLPTASNQDVEFSSDQADSQDVAAQRRAAAANSRQNNSTNK
jgi:hypothetical protein